MKPQVLQRKPPPARRALLVALGALPRTPRARAGRPRVGRPQPAALQACWPASAQASLKAMLKASLKASVKASMKASAQVWAAGRWRLTRARAQARRPRRPAPWAQAEGAHSQALPAGAAQPRPARVLRSRSGCPAAAAEAGSRRGWESPRCRWPAARRHRPAGAAPGCGLPPRLAPHPGLQARPMRAHGPSRRTRRARRRLRIWSAGKAVAWGAGGSGSGRAGALPGPFQPTCAAVRRGRPSLSTPPTV